jgi:hypothetical protein
MLRKMRDFELLALGEAAAHRGECSLPQLGC